MAKILPNIIKKMEQRDYEITLTQSQFNQVVDENRYDLNMPDLIQVGDNQYMFSYYTATDTYVIKINIVG